QARNEVNIAAQPVEFRDNDGCLDLFGLAQRCGELWALVQCVGTFSGLDLDKLTNDLQKFAGGKFGNGIPLRFKAEAALALFVRGNTDVGDDWGWHRSPICYIYMDVLM